MSWYTVNVIKPYKIFEVSPNSQFNVDTIVYNFKFFNPKIFYTYSYVEVTSNNYDTSTTLVNLGNKNYKIQTNSSVSNNSKFKVFVYEGDY